MSPCPSYSLICHSAVLILKCKCDHVTSKIEILKLPPTTLRLLFLTICSVLFIMFSYIPSNKKLLSEPPILPRSYVPMLLTMLFRDDGLSLIDLLQFQLLWESPFYPYLPHHSQTTGSIYSICSQSTL